MPLVERRRRLKAVLPAGSATISEALSVVGRGRELFELMCAHDFEGIVPKRPDDPYDPRVRWLKIKNPGYSQKEGELSCSTDQGGARAKRAMKWYSGPPMSLGNAASARVRLIVWCKHCRHQIEPDPAEMAARDGAETSVLDWRARLVCSQCGSRDIDFVVTGTERR